MNARWHRSLNLLVAIGLVLLAPRLSVAAPAAPGEAPGVAIGRAVVETLVAHRKELGIVAAAATHEVVATSAAEIEKLLEQDLATNGPVSHIVAGFAALVTRTEIETMNRGLQGALGDECSKISLRDCLRSGIRATSHDVASDALSDLTGRWWAGALIVGALLFLISATAAMIALFIRILRPGLGRSAALL